MNKFFNDILTGIDNKTYDIARVGTGMGLIIFSLIEIIKIIITHNFSEMEFSGGWCAILGVGCGSVAIKSNSEPKDKPC